MKTFSDILKGIAVGALTGVIALGAIRGVSASPDISRKLVIPALPSKPLTVDSSVDEVLALMLESDRKWNSLAAEYKLTTIDPETLEVQDEMQKFWLNEKGKWARVEIAGENIAIRFIRNAGSINAENHRSNIFFSTSIPGTFQLNDFNPRELLANGPGEVVYLHPYAKALPTDYYDFLYPTAIAQSIMENIANGTESLVIVGDDIVAERETIIVSRPEVHHLYWVDAVTGVILRAQYFGELDEWQVQFEAQEITFDHPMMKTIFDFEKPNGKAQVDPDRFFKEIKKEQ